MKLSTIAMAAAAIFTTANAHAAEYRVVPLPIDNIGINHFGQVITNDGTLVSTVQNEYDPRIDTSFFDFENEAFRSLLTDPEGAEAGEFNVADLSLILNNFVNGETTQRIAASRSYSTDGVGANLIPAFDELVDGTDEYTGSVTNLVRDALDSNTFVGRSDSVYYVVPYINENGDEINYVVSDFTVNAFVQINGDAKRLQSLDMTLGGLSEAYDISNNMIVAGAGIVSLPEAIVNAIGTCDDPDTRADVPIEKCQFDLTLNLATGARNAHVWQLDNSGNVINLETYGFLFEPEEDDTNNYTSTAYGVNDSGLAVGVASNGEIIVVGQIPQLQNVAVTFSDGVINELLPTDENLLSEALHVNDDYIIGTVTRDFSGNPRRRLFIYNIETESAVYPDGFFSSSVTLPRAINSNNEIVGEGESEIISSNSRDKSAFLYRIDTDEFIDLNTLIACDSDYRLVDATDINDNGEIIANARVRAPVRDAKGEIVLDDNGEQTLIDRVVAVKLEPISGGVIDNCNGDDDQDSFERSGAGIGSFLITFLALITLRRRLRCKR